MVCLGFKPGAAEWQAQMKPRSQTYLLCLHCLHCICLSLTHKFPQTFSHPLALFHTLSLRHMTLQIFSQKHFLILSHSLSVSLTQSHHPSNFLTQTKLFCSFHILSLSCLSFTAQSLFPVHFFNSLIYLNGHSTKIGLKRLDYPVNLVSIAPKIFFETSQSAKKPLPPTLSPLFGHDMASQKINSGQKKQFPQYFGMGIPLCSSMKIDAVINLIQIKGAGNISNRTVFW